MKKDIKKCTFRRRIRALFLAVICIACAAASETHAKDPAISQETQQFLGRFSQALAEVADAARPAIVNISTTSTVTTQESPFGDMFNDPFFRRFFGDQFGGDQKGRKRKSQSSSLGSGVIVSAEGYILTNNHVIRGADEIKVVLYDKREFKGKVVGTDARTDLAVIKINARDLTWLKLGASNKLKIGDVVFAVGNPFALNQTVTMGIVSAVGRSNVGIAELEDFIQTDAAINPGNSGGALVNTAGEMVGINTAIFSMSGGYMGVGFAIPSDMAKTVMDSIIKHGKVIRGYLGVSIQSLTPELAKSLNIRQTAGALVSSVEKDSPAEKAGFKRGDLVVEVNGKKVEDAAMLRNIVAASSPGEKLPVKIIREGKEQVLNATLKEYKEKKIVKKSSYDNVLKGVTVQELTPSLRDKLEIPEALSGVAITEIAPDSPAADLLQPGDVIQEVNRTPIQSAQDYERIVSKIKEKDTVLLLIQRGSGSIYLTINP